MYYNKDFFIKVLTKNTPYKTEIIGGVGVVVSLDPVNAFRYCVLTGSGYLDVNEPELRRIFKRDMFRIFNQANQYELQYGVFDEKTLEIKNSTKKVFNKYPYILDGVKKILFVEYQGKSFNGEPIYYERLRNIASEVTKLGYKTTDFIITLVNTDKIKDMESFFEFLINDFYARQGYLTDSQVPFFYACGTPDIAVYDLPNITKPLELKYKIKGCSFFELMHIERLSMNDQERKSVGNIVFEVKTGSINGSQIKKYIEKKVFDFAYEVIAHKKERSNYSGLVSFDESGTMQLSIGDKFETDKEQYNEWLETYAKMYLIAGLDDAKYKEYLMEHKIKTAIDLINSVKNTKVEDLVRRK